MAWTKEMFGVEKPIIALLHLRALPGDPYYGGDLEAVYRQGREDLIALQEGGVDGILIANEFSLPYQKKADMVTLASLGYLVGRLKEDIKVPYGVNVVLNPLASLELAAGTGASFIRSSFTGAYMGEHGIIDTDIAETIRRKKALGLDHLKMFYKVNPEGDAYLAPRNLKDITHSIRFLCNPDALCVSGASAGCETSTDIMAEVRSVAGDVPVFCNTGCNLETVVEKLSNSDGACVGTTFKKDGKFENNVEYDRVAAFMNKVKEFRKTL
ncbi:MAG: BtpA/SgcQ family protein [Clostridiales bacterium]|nr:BtpA/SgcQ family protein [Clostridiales bacterium]